MLTYGINSLRYAEFAYKKGLIKTPRMSSFKVIHGVEPLSLLDLTSRAIMSNQMWKPTKRFKKSKISIRRSRKILSTSMPLIKIKQTSIRDKSSSTPVI